MDPKEKLYALIKDFIHSRMYISQFCDLFADTYNFEVDKNCLSLEEKKLFSELFHITFCYSECEEDIKACPQYNFSDKQVVAKVDEVCAKLNIS